jgi:polysaccharide export outer membrane protein
VRTTRRLFAVTALMLPMLSACQSSLPLLQGEPVGQGYKLGAGDAVRVTTFGEKDLSGDFTVDDSGDIALPLTGPLSAEGLTSRALAGEIRQTLKSKNLLADPSVVVEVIKYRPIFVLGEVQHPGPYAYQTRMTFLNAVALAGGFTPRAAKSEAVVVRATPNGTVRGRVDQLSQIEPGDIINVDERNF